MALLLAGAGCDRHGPPVHFVIPDGFKGPFYLIKDPTNGAVISAKGNQYTIAVPRSGSVRVHDFAFRDPWHQETASFASGVRIPTETEPGATGELAANVSGLRGGGTALMNSGPEIVHYFIGAEQELRAWAAQQGSAASRSQPVGPETNRASLATGSGG
ncbi:MAG TPA: hypothetical protein VHI52_18990 [Verrucomicrobiae bacterium]|nr:hypothetical protein [Verrucomicrobiae bacterium]